MRKVSVGVIGLGSFAHVARLPILASMENVELTACMSRTPEKVESVARQFGFARKYTGLEELIDESGIEAAFVVTPKQSHYEIVLPLLEKGIHVFCEKPMAMSLREAEEMVQVAESHQRLLMIGFNRRYAPVYEEAKQALAKEPPEVCVALKNRPGTEYRATMENAIHMIDLMRWFCGECIWVQSQTHFEDLDYETTVAAMLSFDSGAIGMLLGNRTCGQWMERVELYGGGKTIIVDCPDSLTVIDQEHEHTRKLTPLRMGWATIQDKLGFQYEVSDFIHCVLNGGEPRTSAQDALKTHILLDKVLRGAGLSGLEA